MKKPLLKLIRGYQKSAFIRKPITRILFFSDGSCKYVPTCSEYMYQAIQKYGSVKGVATGLKRISRCNPWSKGGYDPVK